VSALCPSRVEPLRNSTNCNAARPGDLHLVSKTVQVTASILFNNGVQALIGTAAAEVGISSRPLSAAEPLSY